MYSVLIQIFEARNFLWIYSEVLLLYFFENHWFLFRVIKIMHIARTNPNNFSLFWKQAIHKQ